MHAPHGKPPGITSTQALPAIVPRGAGLQRITAADPAVNHARTAHAAPMQCASCEALRAEIKRLNGLLAMRAAPVAVAGTGEIDPEAARPHAKRMQRKPRDTLKPRDSNSVTGNPVTAGRRGPAPTGHALTPAERQRQRRARLKQGAE